MFASPRVIYIQPAPKAQKKSEHGKQKQNVNLQNNDALDNINMLKQQSNNTQCSAMLSNAQLVIEQNHSLI